MTVFLGGILKKISGISKFGAVLSAGCACFLPLRGAEAADSWSLYDSYKQSYFIDYATHTHDGQKYTTDLTYALAYQAMVSIKVEINGVKVDMGVDTGSTGMALGQEYWASGFTPVGPAGWVYYNSSGLVITGVFQTMNVSILGDTEKAEVTSLVPVLFATDYECLKGAPNGCTPGLTGENSPVYGISMLGVGFDRTTMGEGVLPTVKNNDEMKKYVDGLQPTSQAYNLFLNLAEMQSGEMRRGYIITPTGIYLGLTQENTSSAAFTYAQLLLRSAGTDGVPNQWQQVEGTITVGGVTSTTTLLMDTGITNAFINVPNGNAAQTDGTAVTISLAGGSASYTFLSGDLTNPQTPYPIDSSDKGSFVNSSLHTYAGFNVLFDADGGFVGIAANNYSSDTDVTVAPLIAAQGPLNLTRDFATTLPVLLVGASTINTTATATFDSIIYGANSLTLNGGTIVLNGAVLNTGGVTIGQGTTILNATMTGSLTIASGASFYNTNNGYQVASGQTLTNAGTFVGAPSGAAFVNEGTVDNSGSFLGSVSNPGTWTNSGTLVGIISNDGTLTNSGAVAGEVRNSGTLTNTGSLEGTVANSGVLTNDGSVIGNVSNSDALTNSGNIKGVVSNDGTFTNLGSVTGDITNSGTWTNGGTLYGFVSNDGVLTNTGSVTGDISSSGTWTNAGGLDGDISNSGTFANSGSLVGDVSNSGTFTNSGSITGNVANSGTLLNSGTWTGDIFNFGAMGNSGTIVGDITSYGSLTNSGLIQGTVVNNFVFSNDGTVEGAVTTYGTLSGTGTVSSLTVANAGSVSPGHSLGTVTVVGNATFQSGSLYVAELGAAGTSDHLVVGGTLTAGGATLMLVPDDSFSPSYGATYQVFTAGSIASNFTVDNTVFGTMPAIYPFVGAELNDDGLLTLGRSAVSYTAFTRTVNQWQAASAADTLSPDSPLNQSLAALNGTDVPAAFSSLSGEAYASVKTGLQQQSAYLRDTASGRVRQAFARFDEPAKTAAKTVELVPGLSLTAWGQAYGGWGQTEGNGNAATMSRSVAGFLMGVDSPLGEAWRVGLLGGYSRSAFEMDGVSSSADSDNYNLGLYGGARFGDLGLRFGAGYTWHELSMDRTAAFGNVAQSLSASYQAGTAQAFGEIGYSFHFGATTAEPFANLAYVDVRNDAFSETGGSAALSGESETFGTTYSVFGLRLGHALPVQSGGALMLTGSLGWQHAYGGLTPSQTMSFAGSAPFTTDGVPIARDTALVDVGFTHNPTANIEIGLHYDGAFASSAQDSAVRGTLRVRF